MPRKPALHDANETLMPALESTIAAIAPPAADAGLVALARVLAGSLDRMSNDERSRMLGQTVPPLLKVLQELDRRRERRADPEPDRAPTWLDEQRAALARRNARRVSS